MVTDPHQGVSRVSYPDEHVMDRDARGVLWARHTNTRAGEPIFSQVNAIRQRRAMRLALCQVCGDPVGPERLMLLPTPCWQSDQVKHGSLVSSNPPCCHRCARLARALCPALRSGGSCLFTYQDYEPWGVRGVLFSATGLGEKAEKYGFDDPRINKVVALQLVVRVRGIEVIDRVEPNQPDERSTVPKDSPEYPTLG